MKTALHVNSYFLTNKIHYNLYLGLKERKADKFLIPVYKRFEENHIEGVEVDYIFDSFDKKVFFTKVPKVLLLFRKKKFENFDFFHAHTVISDGLPTYILHLLTGKPYVISVRNTDISLFINGNSLFKLLARKIIKNARAVFFISPSLKNKIESIYPKLNNDKYYLLPNGLDEFWSINKGNLRMNSLNLPIIKLLFVGELIPRKNLDILVQFLSKFTDYNYELHVVGKNTDDLDFEVLNQGVKDNNCIIYHGPIYEKNKLKELYLYCDIFTLLSHAETFGVVYIEALSQGLPVIYSRNEGLDGFFKDGELGYSCNPDDVNELHTQITKIINNYNLVSNNALNAAGSFTWNTIIDEYLRILDKHI